MQKVVVNGVRLACEEQGCGPAVLLIHGFPLCRRMWRPQVEALAAAGFRVITPDLRGFGDSEAPEGPYFMDLFADDLAALLDRLGIEQAVIGGMSMGGYVLLNLLERHRDRLSAALFLVTRAAADDAQGKARRTELAEAVRAGRPGVVAEAFEAVLFAEETWRGRPELAEEVRAWMKATDPNGLAGGLLAMRDRRDYTESLASFDLPALVVGAELDRAVPPQHARLLAERLPRASFRLIPGAGHMANLEQPVEFNAGLLEFLGSLDLKHP